MLIKYIGESRYIQFINDQELVVANVKTGNVSEPVNSFSYLARLNRRPTVPFHQGESYKLALEILGSRITEHLENTPDDHDQSEHDPTIGANGSSIGRRELSKRRRELRMQKETGSAEIKPAKEVDILHAIEHAQQTVERDLQRSDFEVSEPEKITIEELGFFEDLGSWPEWGEEELVGLSEEELSDELTSFRGKEWADRAMNWLQDGFPTMVVVETKEREELGDGRGRASVSIGLGLDMNIVKITEK